MTIRHTTSVLVLQLVLTVAIQTLPLQKSRLQQHHVRKQQQQGAHHDHHHHRLLFDPNTVNAQQEQMRAEQILLTSSDKNWEWILVRIEGVTGLSNADWFGKADPIVSVRAMGDNLKEPTGVSWNGAERPSSYSFLPILASDNPQFHDIGMVAYEMGMATSLLVVLQDVDSVGVLNDVLLSQSIAFDNATTAALDQWFPILLEQGDYTMNISLMRSVTPIVTQEQQSAMGLTEKLLDLNVTGAKTQASLVYKTDAANTKAVLYIPGRSDSFAHPNVLEMYQTLGYDVYSLDARFCGRTRRFMNDTVYGHWIDDFNKYREEMDLTLQFMKQTNPNYSKVVAHAHSTGALIVLNYAMQIIEETSQDPFDAYIFNGPFLDWGNVGGYLNEFVLENAGIADVFGMTNPSEGGGISDWHFKRWLLYRWNVELRPLIASHVNGEWASACTTVQEKITARSTDNPLTDSPMLLVASLGDDTIWAYESVPRMPYLSSNYSIVIFEHNAHDVTMSFTDPLNKDAITEISTWLTTGSPTGNFPDTASSGRSVFSVVTGVLMMTMYVASGFVGNLLF